jgi:hypothetical protein
LYHICCQDLEIPTLIEENHKKKERSIPSILSKFLLNIIDMKLAYFSCG